ncbi:Kinesin-like protein KIF6 [Hondaea fermentalgiana]|uniref:Kinesin-like protein n=1 Tax=Hondaea fermentalgiana TaxID=2315210 RepID=A0A2R5GGJ8_9STRA|nr:Kinesin-like protein KIF6 [Hondaea fermentalgiana]|eukprot:GBG30000.1 Kinesin-like protein KIF6 [Hondaea fermentalgiana]
MRVRTYARVRGSTGSGERSAIDVDEELKTIIVSDSNAEENGEDDGGGDGEDYGSNSGASGSDAFSHLTTSSRAARRWRASRIPFDGVFGPDADQGCVFDQAVRPLLEGVLSGVNCTLFAYGQTGSGKTYTITGRETYESRGVVPRALSVLFEDKRLKRCSVEVACEEDALDAFFAGNMERSTGSTALNMSSSRSHCVFSMEIETATHVGRINFVDLAGSERTQDQTSKHINLSLHFLEQVVIDLQTKKSHVGFRNSTLTALLRDSLTGNCQTAFLVTLNPEVSHVTESLATCKFAQRCSCLTTQVTSNETLSQKIQRLQAENVSLREDLARALGALREHDEIGTMLRDLLRHIDDNVNTLVSSEVGFLNRVRAQVDLDAQAIFITGENGPAMAIERDTIASFARVKISETKSVLEVYRTPFQGGQPGPPIFFLEYATDGTTVEQVAWLQAFEHWLGPGVEESCAAAADIEKRLIAAQSAEIMVSSRAPPAVGATFVQEPQCLPAEPPLTPQSVTPPLPGEDSLGADRVQGHKYDGPFARHASSSPKGVSFEKKREDGVIQLRADVESRGRKVARTFRGEEERKLDEDHENDEDGGGGVFDADSTGSRARRKKVFWEVEATSKI